MDSTEERKLAAIMFADIVGYSRMMALDEKQTMSLLKHFDDTSSPIIVEFKGVIIKKMGDGLFCEFGSTKQAVDCALKIQTSFKNFNDSRPKDFKLQVRIGIHIGDVIKKDGDIFGEGVNVASRIQPLSNPGGICISGAVNETISSHPDYKIVSKGEQELKNIVRKHTIYEVITGSETVSSVVRSVSGDPATTSSPRKNLLYSIIGFLIVLVSGSIYYFNREEDPQDTPISVEEFAEVMENTRRKPISKEELDADKTNIFIPYLGCRDEILENAERFLPFIIEKHGKGTENPDDYKIVPFSSDEKKNLYNELVRRVKTTFHPGYNIITYDDIEKAYESAANIAPDFKTFPSSSELYTVDIDSREKLLEPFAGSLIDTVMKITDFLDDNEYKNFLFIYTNVFKVEPPIGPLEAYSLNEITYRNVTDIVWDNDTGEYDTNTAINGTAEGLDSQIDDIIPDITDFIGNIIHKYERPEFRAYIKSIRGDKIFIKMEKESPLLSNIEMSVHRIYQNGDEKSIQKKIKHVKNFIDCCKENPEDSGCKTIKNMYQFSEEEYEDLVNHNHPTYNKSGNVYLSFGQVVLIEEVYDSIAVGRITDNPISCFEILPGDQLRLMK